MAGGGDLQSPKKRKRDAAGKPKKLAKGGDDGKKRKRPSDANMAQGGGGGEVKVKKEPVTAKGKRLAAKVSLLLVRSVNFNHLWSWSMGSRH